MSNKHWESLFQKMIMFKRSIRCSSLTNESLLAYLSSIGPVSTTITPETSKCTTDNRPGMYLEPVSVARGSYPLLWLAVFSLQLRWQEWEIRFEESPTAVTRGQIWGRQVTSPCKSGPLQGWNCLLVCSGFPNHNCRWRGQSGFECYKNKV